MMGLFGTSRKELRARVAVLESRVSLENPSVSLTDPKAWKELFGSWHSVAGVEVTIERAMGVAPIWAAVNFLSASIASVPIYLFNVTEKGPERAKSNPLEGLVNEAPNEEMSSFRWRQLAQVSLLHHGRSYNFIERNRAQRPMNIWPLEYNKMTVKRVSGRLEYEYKDGPVTKKYEGNEIIDLIWMPKSDGVGHFEPINTLKNMIGLTIALEEYAAKFFQNGGIPPLQLVGPLNSPGAVSRAATDVIEALNEAKKDGRPILPMPLMHELKAIGIDPEKGQLKDARLYQLTEAARMYGLPPVFLQDLTHGTFSNTEQQDLHLVKHTIRQWFRRWEDELNLKLISRRNRRSAIRFDEDELLRGDFKTRMEGYTRGVQGGLLVPDEGREAMGWPRRGGASDRQYIQGATMPLEKVGEATAPAPTPEPPTTDNNGDPDADAAATED